MKYLLLDVKQLSNNVIVFFNELLLTLKNYNPSAADLCSMAVLIAYIY